MFHSRASVSHFWGNLFEMPFLRLLEALQIINHRSALSYDFNQDFVKKKSIARKFLVEIHANVVLLDNKNMLFFLFYYSKIKCIQFQLKSNNFTLKNIITFYFCCKFFLQILIFEKISWYFLFYFFHFTIFIPFKQEIFRFQENTCKIL